MITFPPVRPSGPQSPRAGGSDPGNWTPTGSGTDIPLWAERRHGPRRRYLLLVRQQPTGPGLCEAIAARAAAGACAFHVVVLSRPIALSAVLGSAGDPSSGFISYPDIAEARNQDRRQSADILEKWLARFHRLGFDASGEVAETAPLPAVSQTIAQQGVFNEVLVADRRSVLRHRLAHLAGWELSQRLQRRVHLPALRVDP